MTKSFWWFNDNNCNEFNLMPCPERTPWRSLMGNWLAGLVRFWRGNARDKTTNRRESWGVLTLLWMSNRKRSTSWGYSISVDRMDETLPNMQPGWGESISVDRLGETLLCVSQLLGHISRKYWLTWLPVCLTSSLKQKYKIPSYFNSQNLILVRFFFSQELFLTLILKVRRN